MLSYLWYVNSFYCQSSYIPMSSLERRYDHKSKNLKTNKLGNFMHECLSSLLLFGTFTENIFERIFILRNEICALYLFINSTNCFSQFTHRYICILLFLTVYEHIETEPRSFFVILKPPNNVN